MDEDYKGVEPGAATIGSVVCGLEDTVSMMEDLIFLGGVKPGDLNEKELPKPGSTTIENHIFRLEKIGKRLNDLKRAFRAL